MTSSRARMAMRKRHPRARARARALTLASRLSYLRRARKVVGASRRANPNSSRIRKLVAAAAQSTVQSGAKVPMERRACATLVVSLSSCAGWRRIADGDISRSGLRHARQVARAAKLAEKAAANGGVLPPKKKAKKTKTAKGAAATAEGEASSSAKPEQASTQQTEQQQQYVQPPRDQQQQQQQQQPGPPPQISYSAPPPVGSQPAYSSFFSEAPSASGHYAPTHPAGFHLPHITTHHLPNYPTFDGQHSAGALSHHSGGSTHSPFDSPHSLHNGSSPSLSMPPSGEGGSNGSPANQNYAQQPQQHQQQQFYSQPHSFQPYAHPGWTPAPVHPPYTTAHQQ